MKHSRTISNIIRDVRDNPIQAAKPRKVMAQRSNPLIELKKLKENSEDAVKVKFRLSGDAMVNVHPNIDTVSVGFDFYYFEMMPEEFDRYLNKNKLYVKKSQILDLEDDFRFGTVLDEFPKKIEMESKKLKENEEFTPYPVGYSRLRDMYDIQENGFTDEVILNSLVRAMSDQEAWENFKYIRRMNDLPDYGEEEFGE